MKELNVLLTIFTEPAFEAQLVADHTKLDAPSCTISNASGRGSSGLHSAPWEASSNFWLEKVCEESLATQLEN